MNSNDACSSQPTTLKEGYYSSCEEETDESYSETESERHEESVERDNPPQACDIKRFSGDCDRVVDVLTEHDRTKNRKTYQVGHRFFMETFSLIISNRFFFPEGDKERISSY